MPQRTSVHLFRSARVVVGLPGDAAEVETLPVAELEVCLLRCAAEEPLELEPVGADRADRTVSSTAWTSLSMSAGNSSARKGGR